MSASCCGSGYRTCGRTSSAAVTSRTTVGASPSTMPRRWLSNRHTRMALSASEAELHRELHDTRIGSLEDLSERLAVHSHDRRLERSIVHGRTEPVERVERLDTCLERPIGREIERPDQRA